MNQNILLYTSKIDEAINEITASGGSVSQQLSEGVFVAVFTDEFNTKELKLSSQLKPENLDENSNLLAAAWETAANHISEGESEMKGEAITSSHFGNEDVIQISEEDLEAIRLVKWTNDTMSGKIAVAVVIVSGPSSQNLQFTNDEIANIEFEFEKTFAFFSGNCFEANITFYPEFFPVQISAVPGTNCEPKTNQSDEENSKNATACQNAFRNPALVELKCEPSEKGVFQLAQTLRDKYNTPFAYVAFITKYPMYNSAYALPLTISMYSNYTIPGYSTTQLNQIFSHESAHLFGAADEYKSGKCTCAPNGFYKVPNNNCANCAYTPKVGCLMDDTLKDVVLCNWTRGQLGWGYWNLMFKTMLSDSGSHNRTTAATPALAYFKGNMFMAYRKDNSDNGIKVGYSADGIAWNSFVQLSNVSTNAAPTLAVFNDKLWLAWAANASKEPIAFTWSDDGKSWNNPVSYMPGQSTSSAPSLAAFNNKLYIAWKADDSSDKICYESSSDGTTWSVNCSVINGQSTSAAPALAFHDNKLFIAWKSKNSSNSIYYAYTTDGSTWIIPTPSTISGQSTSAAPAITSFNNRLYIAWKSNNSANTIYYGSSKDGLTWGPNFAHIDSTTTSAGPAIAGLGSTVLNMALKANGSNDLLVDNYLPGLF